MSDDRKPSIALYSTTIAKQPDGTRQTISKIPPTLTPGIALSLHRSNVDYIVTGYRWYDSRAPRYTRGKG